MAYNLLTCAGFEGAQKSAALDFVAGGCMKGRIGIILLFFVIAIIRKWGAEEWGISFNFWISIGLGIIVYFILITITGSLKLALGIGLLAALIGGYGGGMLYPDEGGY